MNDRRQKLAWILLLVGFFTCVGLLVAIPIVLNWTIQEATRSLDVTVQSNNGTVGVIKKEGENLARF